MSTFVGKTLQNGKYTLEQELGRGGFGITYKAIHHWLDQVVVIKTVNDALRSDANFADFQRQFQAEAKRLALCAHPGIVRVSDFFIEDELPYVVMDYIPGYTLAQLVFPDRPLPEAVAIDYIRQVGQALAVLHQLGLLHRDVKPQNLILREGTSQVVLIDFGTAREFSPGVVQTHTSMISEGYAPIEQYLPQAPRTAAIDVYGLAATLYALVTAQVPVASVLRDRQPLVDPRQLRPDLSPATNQAILRGMAMETHQRPATVEAWLALLPRQLHSVSWQPEPVAVAQAPLSQMATLPAMGQGRMAKRRDPDPVITQPPTETIAHPWRPWIFAGVLGIAAIAGVGAFLTRPQPTQVTPKPSATSPAASPLPSRSPEPTPVRPATPIYSPKPTPTVSATPDPTPPPVASPSPSAEPTETPTPTPTPTPSPVTPSADPTPPPSETTSPTPDVVVPTKPERDEKKDAKDAKPEKPNKPEKKDKH